MVKKESIERDLIKRRMLGNEKRENVIFYKEKEGRKCLLPIVGRYS